MTTASGAVAVIATQLAQTDRRALSEAWYSALHLAAGDAPAKDSAPKRQGDDVRTVLAVRDGALPRTASQRAPVTPLARVTSSGGARVEVRDERRRPVSEVARRIERAVVALTTGRPVPAAHTIDVDGGRVRLLVHNDGRSTRIVALCSGPLREHVERALAHARFSLAAAGHAVSAP